MAKARLGLDQTGDSSLCIDLPIDSFLVAAQRQIAHVAGVNGVWGQAKVSAAHRTVRRKLIQVHYKRVARLRTFDVKRPGLRIRAIANLYTMPVHTQRIDGFRLYGIAGSDVKDRFV